MVNQSSKTSPVSDRLRSTVDELRRTEALLRAEDLDPRVLGDFREALDRVRNTAWSVYQYVSRRATDGNSEDILATLAGERVRATFRLCQSLQADLDGDIRFQPGQLLQLYSAVKNLTEQLARVVKEME